jgi:hypothetical protein
MIREFNERTKAFKHNYEATIMLRYLDKLLQNGKDLKSSDKLSIINIQTVGTALKFSHSLMRSLITFLSFTNDPSVF